jgi:hypothetical protein
VRRSFDRPHPVRDRDGPWVGRLLGDDVRPQHGLAADLAVGDLEHRAETSGSVSYRRRDVTGLHGRGLRCTAGVEASRQQASQAMSSRSAST